MELPPEKYKLFFPLPVTVITTVDDQGVPNAAPYSCVMPVLRPLPLIALASALPRDTLRNIRTTGQFIVNIMGLPGFRDAMKCAKAYPPEVNELEQAGLDTLPGKRVQIPRIKDAVGWVEAELEQQLAGDQYAIVVGRVLCSEMNSSYVRDGRLDESPLVLLMPHFRSIGEVTAKRSEFDRYHSSK